MGSDVSLRIRDPTMNHAPDATFCRVRLWRKTTRPSGRIPGAVTVHRMMLTSSPCRTLSPRRYERCAFTCGYIWNRWGN